MLKLFFLAQTTPPASLANRHPKVSSLSKRTRRRRPTFPPIRTSPATQPTSPPRRLTSRLHRCSSRRTRIPPSTVLRHPQAFRVSRLPEPIRPRTDSQLVRPRRARPIAEWPLSRDVCPRSSTPTRKEQQARSRTQDLPSLRETTRSARRRRLGTTLGGQAGEGGQISEKNFSPCLPEYRTSTDHILFPGTRSSPSRHFRSFPYPV